MKIVQGGLVLVALYLMALAAYGLGSRPAVADLAVVFGNEVLPDGRPSARLQARLDTAAGLFAAGLVPRVMVSGGIEQPSGRDEAAVMAAYLVAHDVPATAIVQDALGVDTFATAVDAARVTGPKGRVVVVTQWFHVPRATLAMHRAGMAEVSGAWPRFVELRDGYSFLREAVGVPVYALR